MAHDIGAQTDQRMRENEGQDSKGVLDPTETSESDKHELEWKPTKEVFLILLCLSIIAIMASLDMTIFLPILPVSILLLVVPMHQLSGHSTTSNRGNSISPRT